MSRPSPRQKTYADLGYCVVDGAVSDDSLDALERHLLRLAEQVTGRAWPSVHDEGLSSWLYAHAEHQTQLYLDVRQGPWLTDLCSQPELVRAVQSVSGVAVDLLRKIPLRIDPPLQTRELAVWHQDHFYVGGSQDTVTAWIPLQHTDLLQGCLQVMPGSHQLGPLPHDVCVLGKRHTPPSISHHPVQYAPIRRGQVLLFHANLLHSGTINLSNRTRWSVQGRYAPTGSAVDPGMLGSVALGVPL